MYMADTTPLAHAGTLYKHHTHRHTAKAQPISTGYKHTTQTFPLLHLPVD